MSGQYSDPVRVVAFNSAEHWAEDASEEVAREILRRFDLAGHELPSSILAFVDRHLGLPSTKTANRRRQVHLPRLYPRGRVARAIPAFLAYCKDEAATLITDHLGAAKAIADALVERGELSGAEVDDIIAITLAREGPDDEKTRCKRWRAVEANAERLALNQTGMRRGASRRERIDDGSRWREHPTGMQACWTEQRRA
jgi:hypothetical protein